MCVCLFVSTIYIYDKYPLEGGGGGGGVFCCCFVVAFVVSVFVLFCVVCFFVSSEVGGLIAIV